MDLSRSDLHDPDPVLGSVKGDIGELGLGSQIRVKTSAGKTSSADNVNRLEIVMSGVDPSQAVGRPAFSLPDRGFVEMALLFSHADLVSATLTLASFVHGFFDSGARALSTRGCHTQKGVFPSPLKAEATDDVVVAETVVVCDAVVAVAVTGADEDRVARASDPVGARMQGLIVTPMTTIGALGLIVAVSVSKSPDPIGRGNGGRPMGSQPSSTRRSGLTGLVLRFSADLVSLGYASRSPDPFEVVNGGRHIGPHVNGNASAGVTDRDGDQMPPMSGISGMASLSVWFGRASSPKLRYWVSTVSDPKTGWQDLRHGVQLEHCTLGRCAEIMC